MDGAKRSRRFVSIKAKVLLAFIAVALVALLSYFCFFWQYTYDMAIVRYNEQVDPVGASLASNLEYYIASCVESVRSIYYNTAAFDLLTNAGGNFINGETADSKKLHSYMLSVYAAVPSARQIHLSAYRLERSFLVTTDDFVQYMRVVPGYAFEEEFPERSITIPSSSIWVESSHPMGSYGHFVSQKQSRNQNVFTVHVPLFLLPSSTRIIGLLSVDIATQYIDDNCAFNEKTDTQVYVTDEDDNLVYAMDGELIGQSITAQGSGTAALLDGLGDGEPCYIRDGYLIKTWDLGSAYCSWKIHLVSSLKYITQDMLVSQIILIMVFAAFLILLSIVLYVVLLRYLNPLNRIATFIHINTSQGNCNLSNTLENSYPYKANDEVALLINSIDSMLKTINDSLVSRYQMVLANRTLELRTLQAQINPHFIYNTLQCIASKSIEHGDTETYAYIASFGQLLQYAMDFGESVVTLEQEADYIRRYLSLQSVRFGCDIRFDVDAREELLKARVPKMTLQPLAENAIIHGHICDRENARVLLRVTSDGEWLTIDMRNNGLSIDEQSAERLMQEAREMLKNYEHLRSISVRSGDLPQIQRLSEERIDAFGAARESRKDCIGVSNVFMRFLLHFGDQCRFFITPEEQGGTMVRVRIMLGKVDFSQE